MNSEICLITGLTGGGKTINAIEYIDTNPNFNGRPIYYWNFENVKFNWIKLTDEQVKNWFDFLPEGAVLFVDEAQDLWPPIGQKERPPHYAKINMHRHKGIDIVMVSQMPINIDSKVRSLSHRHRHYMKHPTYIPRVHMTRQFEWEGCQDKPQSTAALNKAFLTHKKINNKYFSYYKSSSKHTNGRAANPKFYAAILLLIIIFIMVFYFGSKILNKNKSTPGPKTTPTIEEKLDQKINRSDYIKSTRIDTSDLSAYISSVKSMPHLAPIYQDHLPEPEIPHISGCMKFDVGEHKFCDCYTQQNTRLNLSRDSCERILEFGIYQPYKPKESNQMKEARTAEQQHGGRALSSDI